MKTSKLYRTLWYIFRPIIKCIYRLEINGTENLPKSGRAILCPNHTSNADPIILGVACKRQVFYMGKSELFKNKIFAKFISHLGAFPVSRGKGDKNAISSAEEILRKGQLLGLFIEGTRSKTGEFLKPKTGAALIAYNTYSPIIPICIRGKKQNSVKAFRKNVVNIGKPIYIKDCNIVQGTSKEFRDLSRKIMENIKTLAP